MKKVILLFFFSCLSLQCLAIVRKHDVKSEDYLVDTVPEFLIDMPGEGHGVLIKPNWVVTVAHLIFSGYTGKEIIIHGRKFEIEKVIIHSNAKKPEKVLFEGDAKPLMDFMKTTSDIALIKLSENVSHVSPVSLYSQDNEVGRVITAFGRGSTGDGINGSVFNTKRKKVLRRMQNVVEATEGNWISIAFNNDASALDLEGIDGSEDSGGPLLIEKNGIQYLAGLFSWDYVEGDLAKFQHGLYGSKSYQVRVSRYIEWLNNTMENQ